MTSTQIHLVTQYSQGLALPLVTFFSKSKAYAYVADLTINGSIYSYTIDPIELIGD